MLSLAAGIVILALVVAAVLSGRRDPPAASPAPVDTGEAVSAAPKLITPPAPLPEPALRRGELVAAAARAAAAYAAGASPPADDRGLVGRPFEIVIPFGCAGPSSTPSADPARWTFDLKNRSITLTAQPQVWTDTGWVRTLVGQDDSDRIEGFWIPRPWLAAETCPTARAPDPGAPAASASEPTVGVVRVFGADDTRVGRRDGRPYQVVRKATDQELSTSVREYRLVLNGRISAFADGQPIRCHSASIDRRPACLLGAEIDRVAFLDPVSGEVLAEWRD